MVKTEGAQLPEKPKISEEKKPDDKVELELDLTEETLKKEDKHEDEAPSAAPATVAKPQQAPTTPKKDEVTQQIESVLAEDLGDLYATLPPETQQEFKQKGEETASKIRSMMVQAKVHFGRVLGLVRVWLKIIPGINKYFLEQEAKIKAEEIIDIAEEEQGEEL